MASAAASSSMDRATAGRRRRVSRCMMMLLLHVATTSARNVNTRATGRLERVATVSPSHTASSADRACATTSSQSATFIGATCLPPRSTAVERSAPGRRRDPGCRGLHRVGARSRRGGGRAQTVRLSQDPEQAVPPGAVASRDRRHFPRRGSAGTIAAPWRPCSISSRRAPDGTGTATRWASAVTTAPRSTGATRGAAPQPPRGLAPARPGPPARRPRPDLVAVDARPAGGLLRRR